MATATARKSAAELVAEAGGVVEAPPADTAATAPVAEDIPKAVSDAVVDAMKKRIEALNNMRPAPGEIINGQQTMMLADEMHTMRTIKVKDGVQPEDIEMHPGFLWLCNTRMKRFDIVHVADQVFRWEGWWRVLYIDSQLQEISLSRINLVKHVDKTTKFDWAAVTVEYVGDRAKWRIRYGTVNIKDGFLTESEAREYINRKQRGVL